MKRITKRSIEDALRQAATTSASELVLKDDEVRGFQVRIRKGRAAYMLYYRASDGTQHRPKVAEYPSISPEVARGIAREMLANVHKGANPSAVRRRDRQAPTISELVDRYIQDYVSVHNRPSTKREIKRVLNAQVKPKLGAIKITSLTREDVARFHAGLKATPYQANRALAYLSKMLSLAAGEWELRPDNPARGIRKFPEKARERFLSDEELRRVGTALAEAQQSKRASLGPLHAIRLLALTGCRLGEILGLRWSDIDFATGVVRLSETKTGRRTFKAAAITLALLSQLKVDATGSWVLSGMNPSMPLTGNSVESAWKRIRKSAKLDDTRLHDFRHTVGTYAGHSGANAFMVRDLLGHKTLAMTNRYVGSEEDPLDAMKKRVENRIDAALNGASATVVPIAGKQDKSHKGAA
jgi:integrase